MDELNVEVPNDLSALDNIATSNTDIAIEVSKLNSMNFIIDAFMNPTVRQLMGDDHDICMYVRHLFPRGINHIEMHARLQVYVHTYVSLKRKYEGYDVQTEGPVFDQMLTEYRSVLLPIIERA